MHTRTGCIMHYCPRLMPSDGYVVHSWRNYSCVHHMWYDSLHSQRTLHFCLHNGVGSKHTLPKSTNILWCSSTCAPRGCSDCYSNYTQIPPLPVLRGQKRFFNHCSVDGWLLDTPTTSWPQTNHRQPACTCSQTHKPAKLGNEHLQVRQLHPKTTTYGTLKIRPTSGQHQLPQQFQTLPQLHINWQSLGHSWCFLPMHQHTP